MTPTQTTTYTITVTGSGSATAQVTVTVTPVAATPTVTISANPTSISAGQSSTLSVTATNSTNVAITDNVNTNSYPLSASGGTQSVSPTATTIYSATATVFVYFSYSHQFLYGNPTGAPCTGTTQASSVVGDTTNSFCIDPNHVAPLSQFFSDMSKGTLPSFTFIEAGYGNNDEHPGSGQSILAGQAQVANILNSFMASPSWKDSVFFLSYDEGGGPYDHVPPVPGHSNDNSDAALGTIADISQIAVNADSFFPCVPSGGLRRYIAISRGTTPAPTPLTPRLFRALRHNLAFACRT